ncbi:uncharacterized protein LOC141684662 [Apium graveolens]|uniref:uncharacterized protein LOC141684662 n=1 Tax=Apium graveolens TaxID=4045 RepID=UPI003D78FF4B
MSDEVSARYLRKCLRDSDEDMELVTIVASFIVVVATASYGQVYRVKEVTWNECERSQVRATWMNTLKNETKCREQLRLDIRCFDKLCHLLQSKGGLVTTRNVTVKEVVAQFLHVLAHDLKNRTAQALFARFGETVSRQFHVVLESILKLGDYYIKRVDHTTNYAHDNKWKWFEGAVGALDGTYIKMIVPIDDRARYRDRKGDTSTNVLATCDPNLHFTYVLPGWEGSASDPRILRDALRRPNDKYFLVDLGYTNCEGFLTPYKKTRYHLNLWRGNIPTNYMELFNLRHSSARNTIERAFGEENMEETTYLQEVEQELEAMEGIDMEEKDNDFISSTRSTNEWTEFMDQLAKTMFFTLEMTRQGKEHSVPLPAPARRSYNSWNSKMDTILTSTLYQQINEGNKGDRDFKPQAYQAVADKLRVELNIILSAAHVKNRIKVWKKHYAVITEIRNYTKFRWDEERKMLVIPVEELEDWKNYCKVITSGL